MNRCKSEPTMDEYTRAQPWHALFGGSLTLLIALVLVASAIFGWASVSIFIRDQAAAWVQAVGGIAAIVGAYSIGSAQMKASRALEEERRVHEDMRRLIIIHAMLDRLRAAFSLIDSFLDQHEPPMFMGVVWFVDEFDDAVLNIKSIHLLECPSFKLARHLPLVVQNGSRFASSLRDHRKTLDDGRMEDIKREARNLWNGLSIFKGCVEGALGECLNELEAAKKSLRITTDA